MDNTETWNRRAREIVFFDVETTFPLRKGEERILLEFGAIVVASQGLYELQSYSTLIKPDPMLFLGAGLGRNSITRKESLADAPSFAEVADDIYNMLNGRIWAGHNILTFDIMRVNEAFSDISRRAPKPSGIIDTLPLLRETFGPRAGNMKMATLARYCGLGEQEHRSLADVRLNLEVLKQCATMLLLENRFPNIFPPLRPVRALPRKGSLNMKKPVKLVGSIHAGNYVQHAGSAPCRKPIETHLIHK
eukprot:c47047_g1_i1 orf=42-785(-)